MTRKTSVLVVDDEAVIRNFLVRVLEREGYHVAAAGDGREALRLLEAAAFDLLLTDIKMDHLDGVGLLEAARDRYPDLAIILLTGHATVDSAVAALRRGASDYLLKPVRNEQIVEAVAVGLAERSRKQRRNRLEQLAGQFSDVIRAETGSSEAAAPETSVICGPLTLDPAGYTAELDGQRLNLTPTEFRLLHKFSHDPGTVFDYVELVRDACGYTCTRQEAQEIIGAHIRNLRHKLGIQPGQALYVEAVRGIGYRLIPAEE
jgi:DNA-binding response OmpR family regulator